MIAYGVDFSGATDAGRRLWVARLEGPRLVGCVSGAELPGGGTGREAALRALVALVAREREAVFGFDFPFTVNAALMDGESWATWVSRFGGRFATPEAFRDACRARTGGKEPKRRTDVLACVPFGSFNLRVYRQTFYGIRDVLAPLVAGDVARGLPMQEPAPGKARYVEICPASTLHADGVYRKGGKHRTYKRDDAGARAVRESHWAFLAATHGLEASVALRDRILADAGGDALDAVIAACGTKRAFERGLPIDEVSAALAWQEGFIYT